MRRCHPGQPGQGWGARAEGGIGAEREGAHGVERLSVRVVRTVRSYGEAEDDERTTRDK